MLQKHKNTFFRDIYGQDNPLSKSIIKGILEKFWRSTLVEDQRTKTCSRNNSSQGNIDVVHASVVDQPIMTSNRWA